MKKLYLVILSTLFICSAYAQREFSNSELQILKKKPYLLKHLQNKKAQRSLSKLSKGTTQKVEDSPSFNDVELFGGTGRNSIYKSFEGADGNIYSFGYYHKTLTIEDQTIESDSITTYFMAEYNSSGELLQLKNIMTFPSDTDFSLENILQFDGGFLWTGISNKDLMINEQNYSINERRAFLIKIDSEGNTSWFKDYSTNRFPRQRGAILPTAVSADSIYVSLNNATISTLNNLGEETSLYNVIELYGAISAILVNGNSLVFSGYFENFLTVGNLSVSETNQYEATFLTSIDIDTKNTEFLLENSVAETEFGDSYPLKLLNDDNQDIYLYGNSRGAISWENGVIEQGYSGAKFLSKFSSDGTINYGTRFFETYQESSDIVYSNGKIFSYYSSIFEYDFSIPLSDENLIIIDTALNYVNNFYIQLNDEFETSLSKMTLFSSDRVALSGAVDYNTDLTVFDLNSESITLQKRTDELSGTFSIRGLLKDDINQSYIAGNKFGHIDFKGQELKDGSSAILRV